MNTQMRQQTLDQIVDRLNQAGNSLANITHLKADGLAIHEANAIAQQVIGLLKRLDNTVRYTRTLENL